MGRGEFGCGKERNHPWRVRRDTRVHGHAWTRTRVSTDTRVPNSHGARPGPICMPCNHSRGFLNRLFIYFSLAHFLSPISGSMAPPQKRPLLQIHYASYFLSLINAFFSSISPSTPFLPPTPPPPPLQATPPPLPTPAPQKIPTPTPLRGSEASFHPGTRFIPLPPLPLTSPR